MVGTLLHVVDAEHADASIVAAEPARGLNGRVGRKGRLLAAWQRRRRRASAAGGGVNDAGDDDFSLGRLSEHDVELVEKFADFLLEAEREEERQRHGGLEQGEGSGGKEEEELKLGLEQPLEDQMPAQQPSSNSQPQQPDQQQPQQRVQEQQPEPQPDKQEQEQQQQPEQQPAPEQQQQPEQQPVPEQHPDEHEQQQQRRRRQQQEEVQKLWLGRPLEDRPPDQQQQPPEPKQEGTPAPSVAEDSSSTTNITIPRTASRSSSGSSHLEVLATLLAQYRVDMLVHKQKRQALPSHQDDATALRAFERTLALWQAKPDVQSFAQARFPVVVGCCIVHGLPFDTSVVIGSHLKICAGDGGEGAACPAGAADGLQPHAGVQAEQAMRLRVPGV